MLLRANRVPRDHAVGSGTVGRLRARDGATADAASIVQRADGGDPAALRVLARYEDRLARALTAVLNLLNPDVIVLGGGLSNVQRLYANVPPLLRPFGGEAPRTRLVQARFGDSSGVRGAAWLWGPSHSKLP